MKGNKAQYNNFWVIKQKNEVCMHKTWLNNIVQQQQPPYCISGNII